MLQESMAHLPSVRIVSVSTLLVNVARDVGASAIVKGLRAVSDFESEMQMAQMNRHLSGSRRSFCRRRRRTRSSRPSCCARWPATAGTSRRSCQKPSTTSADKFTPGRRPWTREPVTDLFDDQHSGREDDLDKLDAEGLIRRVIDVSVRPRPCRCRPRCSSAVTRSPTCSPGPSSSCPTSCARPAGCCVSARNSSPSAPVRPSP